MSVAASAHNAPIAASVGANVTWDNPLGGGWALVKWIDVGRSHPAPSLVHRCKLLALATTC